MKPNKKPQLVAVYDKAGNEIALPPTIKPEQQSERQIRCAFTPIPKFGPRTGSHPMAVYDPVQNLMSQIRHLGNYLSALVGAADNAPVAFHSRIDCALTHLEMR